MERPTQRISTEVPYYSLPDEIWVREMQESYLHYLEIHVITPPPKALRDDGDYQFGWTIHAFADNRRGFLFLVEAWEDDLVNVTAELTECFSELKRLVGIDFAFAFVAFDEDENENADFILRDGANHAALIEREYEAVFEDAPFKTENEITTFLHHIKPWASVRTEDELREFWEEFDAFYGRVA